MTPAKSLKLVLYIYLKTTVLIDKVVVLWLCHLKLIAFTAT